MDRASRIVDPYGSIEVSLLQVEACRDALAEAASLLTTAERARAAAFALPAAREEFLLGRAVLRCLLGRRLQRAAVEVPLLDGIHGKPALQCGGAGAPWFNLSHSHGVVAIGISDAAEIGVDLERIDRTADVVELARCAWGETKAAELAAVTPPAARVEMFFAQWVRFEAAAKCHGTGIGAAEGEQVLQYAAGCRVLSVYTPNDEYLLAVASTQPGSTVLLRWIEAVEVLQVFRR